MPITSAINGLIKGNAARKASNELQQGISNAKNDTTTSFNNAMALQQPYIKAGDQALGDLSSGVASGGEFNRPFTISDFNADPGYNFRVQQGQRAVDQGAAARGGVLSGATLKGEQQFGQDLGSQEYQSAWQRYNTDMNGRFNRLSSVAGMGQNATNAGTNLNSAQGSALSNLDINNANVRAGKELAYGNQGANIITNIGNAASSVINPSSTLGKIASATSYGT